MQRLYQIYQWLVSKRSPLKKEHVLHQGNLFIFPSLLGGFYLILIFILWLLGTNYNNNLILALSYLLVSISLVSIFHTYNNMKGLLVGSLKADAVFSGEMVYLHLLFERSSLNDHQSVKIHWQQNKQVTKRNKKDQYEEILLDWGDNLKLDLYLPIKTARRGKFQPPKLVLKSYYPLGLLKCWSYLALDTATIVYPKPIEYLKDKQAVIDSKTGQEAGTQQQKKADLEFQDLQVYREGEPMTHIAWKQYARTGELYRKNFEGKEQGNTDLHWEHYKTATGESRLQFLAHDALVLAKSNLPYRLVIPSGIIESAKGDRHLHQVLTALALYSCEE